MENGRQSADAGRVEDLDPVQLERVLRVLVRARLRRHREHVAGPTDERLSAGVEGSGRIGEPLDGMAEMQLERAPRVDELAEGLAGGEARQLEVVDGVRAD